jgi:citrate-Mg2+:H+ or citrate-Ca2+:H+ symporter, CitMHS family
MLTWLGLCTIGALLALILFRVTSVLVAFTLVPVAAALIAGLGPELGGFAMDGIRSVTPVAVLLAFAVVYFGVMNDAGLFDPIVRGLVRTVGSDPVRIAVGTAAIATVSHLDGAGAATFMVTIPAMLPVYQRVRMDPLVLTCTTALAAGTMNMLPWGGPTTRAAASLQISTSALFLPVTPAMTVGMVVVFLFAVHIGRKERARLAREDVSSKAEGAARDRPSAMSADAPASGRLGGLWFFNAALTVATLAALFAEIVAMALVFLLGSALALLVNYPNPDAQRDRLTAHGHAAMMMVTTVFAAGVFTGILTKSGMLSSISTDLVRALPDAVLRHLPVVMGVASMPLSLVFDPDSFYFGLLPILAEASQAAGGSAIEVGRAAVLGQMTTGFPVSPLTPATFLLVGLAGVDLGDHQRRTIPYAFAVTLVMTIGALATGAIGL